METRVRQIIIPSQSWSQLHRAANRRPTTFPQPFRIASPFSHPLSERETSFIGEREREKGRAHLSRARLKSMALRVLQPLSRPARLPRSEDDTRGIFSWVQTDTGVREREIKKMEARGEIFAARKIHYVVTRRGSNHFSNSSETPGLAYPPRTLLFCSPPTISSPLKLNSRSIRPQGRFCSNGSEINVSFKRSRSPVIGGH